MTVKPSPKLSAPPPVRRDAQSASKAPAAPRPLAAGVRQRLQFDELSRGRGAALRSPAAAAKLGLSPASTALLATATTAAAPATTPAFSEKGPKLQRGSRGEEVLQLQQTLVALGYEPGPLDGKFGPSTEKAVKQYQKDHGLSPDGVVGPRTRSALASSGSAPSVDSPAPNGPSAPPQAPATGPGEPAPSTSAYATMPSDAFLAVEPSSLPPAEQKAYLDEAYRRAADLYFRAVEKKPHDLSKISDADFALLSGYAGKLGLTVNREGRVWGTERERPIFNANGGDLPPQGYDLAIDQWCITMPGDERYASGRKPANSRYAPSDGKTRCDLFVRDVIHAVLGVVLPANSANRIYEYLTSEAGAADGWIEVSAEEAQRMANEGQVVVAARHKDKEKKQSGHVQIIRPQNSERDENPPLEAPVAAQAGKSAYGYDEASKGMSRGTIRYFYHP